MTPRPRSRILKPAMLAAAVWACLTAAAAADTLQKGSTSEGGVRVAWTYAPAADDAGLGTLDVHTSDAVTGQPVRYDGGKLRGWLQRDRAALSDAEIDCATRVKTLVAQGIGRRADIDLNEYRLMTLNSDGTLAFINPFVGLNNAKLESMVELNGAPRDWVQVQERMELWVLLDGPPRLVDVDLQSRRIRRTVDLPVDSQPTGLALDGVAGMLFTAMPHRQEVASLAIADPDASLQISAVPGIAGLSPLDPSHGLSGILMFDGRRRHPSPRAGGRPPLAGRR